MTPSCLSEILISEHVHTHTSIILTQITYPDWELNQGCPASIIQPAWDRRPRNVHLNCVFVCSGRTAIIGRAASCPRVFTREHRWPAGACLWESSYRETSGDLPFRISEPAWQWQGRRWEHWHNIFTVVFTVFFPPLGHIGWLRGTVGRTSVFDRRTFPVLCSTCSWWVTTYVGKPFAVGQPTSPTQPSILLGVDKWVVGCN